jgi:hypothetical protein
MIFSEKAPTQGKTWNTKATCELASGDYKGTSIGQPLKDQMVLKLKEAA